jgi:gamma-glutamylcyclotransferase (GGCT)/AIG2-like uncharacterized protein YtfP
MQNNEMVSATKNEQKKERVYNMFVYGTLALKEKQKELDMKFDSIVEYDYIKGYGLTEIQDEGTYLCARRKEDGIITGRVLVNVNLDECWCDIEEWEGENYEAILVETEVNKMLCWIFVEKQNKMYTRTQLEMMKTISQNWIGRELKIETKTEKVWLNPRENAKSDGDYTIAKFIDGAWIYENHYFNH